ncbi:MAG: wax ester/triacylglycerol synthase family O-acyltransferase [Sphingomonadales bacterium]|nr:wax ester/triacylglycerol synthase family O-acyltransferase [Sphingomonadales bacterium]MBD3773963.1 wax ester/triacylglycerol synthase family O-acyltransferase [Paracoccaceae bacterium]
MRRISASDAIFLDLETPNAPLTIGGLIILDPSTAPGHFVRHRDILQYVETRLHLAPNLRRKLVYHPLGLDEPRLIDDPDFDLEFHVRHIALPKPRDWRQLKIMTSRLISRPMDLHRPLWEMYVIEGLEELEGIPDDAFAMLIKLHHAVFDGAAAGAASWAFMQDTPDYEPLPPEKRWVPEREPDLLGWTVSSVQEGVKQWVDNMKALPGMGKNLAASARLTGTGPGGFKDSFKGMLAPKTRFQQPVTSHRVWDFVSFPMEEMQAIRTALGKPKMNDLIMAIIAGGLRRYLDHHGELPVEPLQSFCPINVRAGNPIDGGNFVSGMRVSLATDIADPIERLQAIGESSIGAKAQAQAIGGDFFANLLAFTPYAIRSRVLGGLMAVPEKFDIETPAVANVVISNSPPPKGGHYFTGAKVIMSAGYGPIVNLSGVFHAITGLDFESTISVTSCREIMPDPAFYIDCIKASYEEMKAAAADAGAAAAKAGKAAAPRESTATKRAKPRATPATKPRKPKVSK